MTYRRFPARVFKHTTCLCACTALALMPVGVKPVFAAISLTDATSYTASLSATDLDTLKADYAAAQQELASKQADAVQMKALLDAGSTSVTQDDYTALQAEIAKLQQSVNALAATVNSSKTISSQSTYTDTDGSTVTVTNYSDGTSTKSTTAATNQASGSTSNESGSSSSNPLGGIASALGQGALMGALQQSGLLNNLNAGLNGLNAGLGGGGGAGMGGGAPQAKTQAQKDAEEAAKKKAKAQADRCARLSQKTETAYPDGGFHRSGGDVANENPTKTATTEYPDGGFHRSGGDVANQTAAQAEAAKPKQLSSAEYAALEKECQVQYDTKNPRSKGTGPTSIEEARALVARMGGECIWGSNSEARNKCECASLAKELAGLDRASTWKQGPQATWGLEAGTAIATMSGGAYCDSANRGGRSGCHAAVYLGNGYVIEQWNNSGGPQVNYWPASKLAKYSVVISGKQTAWLPNPLLAPKMWLSMDLKPYDMGLSTTSNFIISI